MTKLSMGELSQCRAAIAETGLNLGFGSVRQHNNPLMSSYSVELCCLHLPWASIWLDCWMTVTVDDHVQPATASTFLVSLIAQLPHCHSAKLQQARLMSSAGSTVAVTSSLHRPASLQLSAGTSLSSPRWLPLAIEGSYPYDKAVEEALPNVTHQILQVCLHACHHACKL